MADLEASLSELFSPPNTTLQPDILGELLSILRVHSLSPQDLFFKWESYSIKMGGENASLDYKTVRDFKKDLQDTLERESRAKGAHGQSVHKRSTATPRANNGGDVFGMCVSISRIQCEIGCIADSFIQARWSSLSHTRLSLVCRGQAQVQL